MAGRYLLLSAAVGASVVGMAAPSFASPVTDNFTGFITGVVSDQFADPGPDFSFNPGDAISGTINYDSSSPTTSVSATLTDVTTGAVFTLPAAGDLPPGSTDSVTGAPPTYTLSADDSLEFPSTYTPFTADLTLALVNEIGTGSLFIDVPAEQIDDQNQTGNPEETLSVTFDVPEPASITLLGLAFAGVTRLRRRRSR